jgi:hypothetical protein
MTEPTWTSAWSWGGGMIIIAMTVKVLFTAKPAGAATAGTTTMDSSSLEVSTSMNTSIEATLNEIYYKTPASPAAHAHAHRHTDRPVPPGATQVRAALSHAYADTYQNRITYIL